MALFDFLKRKKETAKSLSGKTDKKPTEKKVEKASLVKKTSPVKQDVVNKSKKRSGVFSYNILKEPHISEKATNLGALDKYVFKVYNNVNKQEVKKAVEGIYGVDVLSVKVINIPPKKRRLGRQEGFRKGYIKAVVTIKEGQKIEIL